VRPGGDVAREWLNNPASLSFICQAAVEPMTVGVYDALPQAPTVDGILGLDFLQRFKFTIDTTDRFLRLDPGPPR
jgi:hypothetical protein